MYIVSRKIACDVIISGHVRLKFGTRSEKGDPKRSFRNLTLVIDRRRLLGHPHVTPDNDHVTLMREHRVGGKLDTNRAPP